MQIFSQFYWRLSVKKSDVTHSGACAGFTLIEMLVVVGIMIVMTAVVLIKTSQFNGSILLRSLASEIGLSLREAQLYGVSTKEVTVGGGNFNAAYGVYFDTVTLAAVGGSYVLFADIDSDKVYDDPGEQVENFKLPAGFTISSVCAKPASTGYKCSGACPIGVTCSAVNSNTVSKLNVSFIRPDPNATFTVTDSIGNTTTAYTDAMLVVSPPSSSTINPRIVHISLMGLISIQ